MKLPSSRRLPVPRGGLPTFLRRYVDGTRVGVFDGKFKTHLNRRSKSVHLEQMNYSNEIYVSITHRIYERTLSEDLVALIALEYIDTCRFTQL
jgi:hypothetical protein